MSRCNKCYTDDCSGRCEMDKYFGSMTDKKIIYANNGFSEQGIREDLETIEQLSVDLPDVDYILDNIVYYMFTNELTTSDKDADNKLYDFLYSLNFNGQRNVDVLKGVAKGYRKYGYYGLLGTSDGLVGIHPKDILASVVPYEKTPVLKQTLTYIIGRDSHINAGGLTRNGFNRGKTIGNLSSEEVLRIVENPKDYEDQYLVVDDDTFSCVRLDTSKVFGISPLLKDRKRVQLILNILDRMNYDIARNGVGTIALRAKASLSDELEEKSEQGIMPAGGELLDMGRTAKAERELKIEQDMQKISDQLATMNWTDSLVYPSRFDELKQLSRDTKPVDFIDYLSQYIPSIVSQMFGVPARLFDLGKTVSNIGTHSIIDNSMRNCIIPMREHFLGQCNSVLKNSAGITEQIDFASYEFARDYNYTNDIRIIEVYNMLKEIDENKAERYLKKNLII